MSLVHRTICHCDECGHEWIPEDAERLPSRCPSRKCRKTTWNHAKVGVEPVSRVETARTVDSPRKASTLKLGADRNLVQRKEVSHSKTCPECAVEAGKLHQKWCP